jgi:antitoxin component YwqK of YwqJK toxin-antitoxin module
MKICILIVFCICTITSFSQGNKINKIDSLGLKQGLWIEYDSLDVEGYSVSAQIIPDSTGKSDQQYEIVTKYDLIKHRGLYSNGIKTGLWKVYNAKNRLWMKIRYDSGQRTKVEIFYSNGRLLYMCDKLDDDFFLIKEFTKKGAFVKETKESNEFVNKLSETKLYMLGF